MALKLKNIDMRDGRVTKVYEWLSGICASLLIIVLVWIGSTLTTLREDVAVMKAQQAPLNGRIDRVETKVESANDHTTRIELRLTSMEARWQEGECAASKSFDRLSACEYGATHQPALSNSTRPSSMPAFRSIVKQ